MTLRFNGINDTCNVTRYNMSHGSIPSRSLVASFFRVSSFVKKISNQAHTWEFLGEKYIVKVKETKN